MLFRSLATRFRGDSSRGRYANLDSEAQEDEDYDLRAVPPGKTTPPSMFSVAYYANAMRLGKRRGPVFLFCCCLVLSLPIIVLAGSLLSRGGGLFSAARTAFGTDGIRKIWEWEVRSGHYPSTRPIPVEVGLTSPPHNPAIPPVDVLNRPPASRKGVVQYTVGTGVRRIYPEVRNGSSYGFPPRPIPGSVADLDKISEQCNFDAGKYVRDCHEFLRLGAGLDNDVRLRRGAVQDMRYVYLHDEASHSTASHPQSVAPFNSTLLTADGWERELSRPPEAAFESVAHQLASCSEDEPRVFHMFWAGPFTDKPYMAMLSFLYTQNLGLHLDTPPTVPTYCRPQLWMWVSLGPTDTMPNPTVEEEMYRSLRSNAWAAPFLHERFKDVIRFRLWNTTEQLDSLPELKEDWRRFGQHLLNSDGGEAKVDPNKKIGSTVTLDGQTTETFKTYNKVPVVLSDLVRFVLCHRYGGIYLDVDILFLRDWEELWNTPGAFSYRWSWKKLYNTAVFRLRRGSALGTFFLRTALVHGLDFHPHRISRYLQDAHMEELLYQIPTALFDPGWLSSDSNRRFPWDPPQYFERDRPPQPFFTDFDQFFNTPPEMSGMPSVIGFDGFYRGAYSYHWHNEWWKPFDRARFWPDLGPRFAEAEQLGRAAVAKHAAQYETGIFSDDERDLTWATVMKRTFEAYIRGERPNMYGEWIRW